MTKQFLGISVVERPDLAPNECYFVAPAKSRPMAVPRGFRTDPILQVDCRPDEATGTIIYQVTARYSR
mgnify:CR=1 FL=1